MQLQPEKTRPSIRQVDVAARAAGTVRRVDRPPAPATRRCAHPEPARWCAAPPIDDEPTEPARLDEVEADPRMRIVAAGNPARPTERLIGIESGKRARGARPRVRWRRLIL